MRSSSLMASASALAALGAAYARPAGGSADQHEMRVKSASGAEREVKEQDAELAKLIKGVADDLVKRDAELDAFMAKATEELKNAGELTVETKSALEKLSAAAVEVQSRLSDLEQKAVRGMGGGSSVKSLGEQFTESDEVVSAIKAGQSFKGTATFNLKAITSATADAGGSAGALLNPLQIPGIIAPQERTLTVRQLITPGRISTSSLEYFQETGFTNAAAMVAEMALKPESTMKFASKTANVRTLAHWVIASKQILDDVPVLQSYIDGRLRYGLAIVEEDQLLLGDGTGQNLLGLIPQATDFDEDRRVAGDTQIDIIRRAITQVRIAEFRATGIVLHPNDWEKIELTKTDDKAYVFANPQNMAQPRLWGLPVVDSTAMPEGEFMVGAFRLGAQLFDREAANVQISTEDRDNFVKNAVTIRAEERLALAVYRPESFVHGDLEDPAP